MVICSVIGCGNKPDRHKSVRYYSFPKLRLREGAQARELSERRRRLWKAAINRKLERETKWEKTVVCSKYFFEGKKKGTYLIVDHVTIYLVFFS